MMLSIYFTLCIAFISIFVGGSVVPTQTQGPTGQLVRRQTCPTLYQPSPAGLICGAQGNIPDRDIAVLQTVEISHTGKNLTASQQIGLDYCYYYSQENFVGSHSFSYTPYNRHGVCIVYFKSLSGQNFVRANYTFPIYQQYYDLACFNTQVCPVKTDTSTYSTATPTQASSCRASAGLSPNCPRSGISLKKTDPISTVVYENCENNNLCYSVGKCKSWFQDEQNNTCVLYGESLEAQGIINATNTVRTQTAYYDRSCLTASCTACYSATPSTSFMPATTPVAICPQRTPVNLVRNPSFEDSQNAKPWKFNKTGVTLKSNDQQNAADGENYIEFSNFESSARISIEQTIAGLQSGMEYQVQAEIRGVKPLPSTTFYVSLDDQEYKGFYVGGPHHATIYDYLRIRAYFTAKNSSDVLRFHLDSLGQNGTYEYLLDNISMHLDGRACKFRLQVSSLDKKLDGLYFQTESQVLGYHNYYGLYLTANISNAAVVSMNSLGYLSVKDSDDLAYLTHAPAGLDFFVGFSLNYEPLQCGVTSNGVITCTDTVLHGTVFKWCYDCQLPSIDPYRVKYAFNNLAFINAQNPILQSCSTIQLNAIYV